MPKTYKSVKTIREEERKKLLEEMETTKNTNPVKSDSGALSAELPLPIDIQDKPQSAFAKRATGKLMELADSKPIPRAVISKKDLEQTGDLATLISAVFVLGYALSNVPVDVKPTDDETNIVAAHLAKITLRHIDISGKISADVMDLIGIIAVSANWYNRVSPALAVYRQQAKERQAGSVYTPINPIANAETITPLTQADPHAADWLQQQEGNL